MPGGSSSKYAEKVAWNITEKRVFYHCFLSQMCIEPLHVNVQENAPLHIHIKKPKSIGISGTKLGKNNSDRNAVYEKKISHPPCKTKLNASDIPWLTSLERTDGIQVPSTKFNWNSTTALLEINRPRFELNVSDPKLAVLRQRHVLREANDQLQDHIKCYDTKIKGFMTEVGTLKNETRNLSNQVHQRNALKSAEIKLLEDAMKEPPIGKNRHLNCFVEPHKDNPVDRRVKKTLNRLINAAIQSELNDQEEEASLSESVYAINGNPLVPTKENVIDKEIEYPVQESTRINSLQSVWKPTTGLSHSDLSSLENELASKKKELLASKQDYEEKQEELRQVIDELAEIEEQRKCMVQNLHQYKEDVDIHLDYFEEINSDDNALYCQLLALEGCGAEARKQVAALRDVLQRGQNDHPLVYSDVNALNKQRELLLKKLMRFDICNRTAMKLVLTEERVSTKVKDLQKSISTVLGQIKDSDGNIVDMRSEIVQKRDSVNEYNEKLKAIRKKCRTLEGLHNANEETCNRLQKAIVEKEFANQKLQDRLAQAQVAYETVVEQQRKKPVEKYAGPTLADQREIKAFKREIQFLRHRAKAAEEALCEAQQQLDRQEQEYKDTMASTQHIKFRCIEMSNQESILEDHAASLQMQATSPDEECPCVDINIMKRKIEKLRNENCILLREIDRYKRNAVAVKQRCLQAQDNVTSLLEELRAHKMSHTELMDDLRQSRFDSDEMCICEVPLCCESFTDTTAAEDLEKFHDYMLEKLEELRPLPKLLQKTEDSLHEALQKLGSHNEKSVEHAEIISKLRKKNETSLETKAKLEKEVSVLNNENDALRSQVRALGDRFEESELHVRRTKSNADELDWKVQQLENQLEKTVQEKNCLKNMLESVKKERKSSLTAEIGKAFFKNSLDSSRITDLEMELDRLKSDANLISKAKRQEEQRGLRQVEDVERKRERTRASTNSLKESVSSFKSNSELFGKKPSTRFRNEI